MPHLRKRHLEPLLKKSLSWSPVVGVLGARQAGKTTLLKQFGAETRTFDDPRLGELFAKGGVNLLESARKPLFLDEVQKYPPVFDLIKLMVDQNRKPGQFLITGSVRFSSKADIRESLTGRIIVWELLPLTLREAHSKGPSTLMNSLAKDGLQAVAESLESRAWSKRRDWEHYSRQGGMPGVCFSRDKVIWENSLRSLVDTVITRDFYFLRNTKIRAGTIHEVLQEVAYLSGESISVSVLARRFRVSVPTMKAILTTFEDLFLIRSHGRKFYFEDLGIAHLLRTEGARKSQERTIEELVFSELKSVRAYHSEEKVSLSSYSTRGGAEVPFVVSSRTSGVWAVVLDEEDFLSEKSLKGLYSFQKAHPEAKLLHLHRGDHFTIHKDRVLSAPVGWIL
jgi:predicted AAA+ superfamily ATPase